MLSLIYIRDIKNNKLQENEKFTKRNYNIQDIKDVQHKNVNMTWYYRKFPRHPVAAENFKMRGRNNILLCYYYRFDKELGRGVFVVSWIPCACTAYVDQLYKY